MTPSNPPRGVYPEVSVSAVIFAIFVGIVMNASITLAGLRIGFTISGSAIAALLGFGVLRGVLRRGSILETNIAQTVASGVNIPNSGVIFTVPVLVLLGTTEFSLTSVEFWILTLSCVVGGVLGTAFIIPLRKQMIDIDRLRFPTPTGVATILKSPGAGAKKALVLLLGVGVAALIHLPKGLPGVPVTASVDELATLVEDEHISDVDAARTRQINGWIENGAVPAEVLAKGELEAERQRLDDAQPKNNKKGAPDPVVTARLAELETELAATLPGIRPALALAALEASRGDREWSSLRNLKLGWARGRLPGYGDLGWRLAPDYEESAVGTPEAERQLTRRVDRDQSGQPDLVLTDSTFDFGRWIGLPDEMQLVFAIAPFCIGAGFITGHAGLFVLAGGILAFLLLNPIAYALGWFPQSTLAHEAPTIGYLMVNRPLGIGLLLGGAFLGIVASLPAIREAVRSIMATQKAGGASKEELGFRPIVIAAIAAFVLLFIGADYVGHRPINDVCPVTNVEVEPPDGAERTYEGYVIAFANEEVAATWDSEPIEAKDATLASLNAKPGLLSGLNPHLRALIIALVGALWMWFAGIIIAQCTGMTDWSPISGMALLTVVLVMILAGTGAVFGAVLIGAALCVAITLASDMMGDMKTGYLVGAQPRRQQILELGVVWIGPIVAMMTILLIVQSNLAQGGPALGPGSPLETGAPQAQALQAIIQSMQGGEMPYALYGLGAVIGAFLGFTVFSGLGVLVGLSMYLPFAYIATYGIGCVINIALRRIKGATWTEEWGVPLAAGLIVGDSVVDLCFNGLSLAMG